LIVFDLDGTLIDSRRDLATAVNAMLAEMRRPALPENVIAEYVGDGAGMLVRRALGDPADEAVVADGLERFLMSYRKHMLDHTYVYEGVFSALDALRSIRPGAGEGERDEEEGNFPSAAKAASETGELTDGLKAVPFNGGLAEAVPFKGELAVPFKGELTEAVPFNKSSFHGAAEGASETGELTEGLKAVPFNGELAVPFKGERKFAVLTNKPVNPSRRICEALGLSKYFFQIYGGNSFGTKKPDPEGLNALMREAGARPEETLMIGDSVVDVLTARNAGAYVIGCTFGLSSHTLETVSSDCMVDAPSGWAAALNASFQK
jgi:phosphoglycolate phosphatase-like HAD superfamily hydrolase